MSVFMWTVIICVIYILITLYLGWVSGKKANTGDQYATGRKQYGPFFVGLILAATFASGSTFLGLGGLSYGNGWSNMWYILMYPTGGFIALAFFGRAIRNMNRIGARTLSEYVGYRYDSSAVRIIAAIISVLLLFYVATQLVAAGTLIEALLNVEYRWGVVFTALFMVVYMWKGGAHASAYTEVMQALIMVGMGVIIIGIFLSGGPDMSLNDVNRTLVERNTYHGWDTIFNPESVGLYDALFPVIMIFVAHIPFAAQPQMGGKLLLLDKSKKLPIALMVGCIATLIMACGGGFAGLLGPAYVQEEVARADMVNIYVMMAVGPKWLTGLFCTVVLAAIMSTACGLFLSIGQILSNDIFRKTIVPWKNIDQETNDKWYNILSKLGLVIAAVGGIVLAFNPPEYLTVFVWMGIGGIMAGVGAPLFIGIYWRGATKAATIVTMIVGEIGYIVFLGFLGWQPYSASGVMFIACCCLLVIVSLFTKKLPEEHLKFFFDDKEKKPSSV